MILRHLNMFINKHLKLEKRKKNPINYFDKKINLSPLLYALPT